MTWLITGGTGYIGAHVALAMAEAGERVVVLDDVSSGVPERLPAGIPLVRGSLGDRELVDRTLAGHGVTGVVHLAAKKQVGESVEQPLRYYRENVHGLTVLLEAAVAAGIERFLFSSSAAVYGVPDVELIDEDTPAVPINPYGETKHGDGLPPLFQCGRNRTAGAGRHRSVQHHSDVLRPDHPR
jgi:UDP-glucose 4-epimerase